MLRTSLFLVALAILCGLGADLEIARVDPALELKRMLQGALAPDVGSLWAYKQEFLNTITFAFLGVALGAMAGGVLAFFFKYRAVRLFCAFIRAVHELFWAFLFLPLVGLNSICGILAIAVPYAGVFAKVYAEILQESDRRPIENLPQAGRLSRFLYGVWPVVSADVRHYTSYRFECGLRSSAVLGFIGLPTLGYHLETAFREGIYNEAAALLYLFFLLIASLKWWLRAPVTPIYFLVSLWLIPKDIHFSLKNMVRTFGEMLPWPMRREGVLDGTGNIEAALSDLGPWLADLFQYEIGPGAWNTILLTQIALAGAGLFTLMAFPFKTRVLDGAVTWLNPIRRWLSDAALIVMRTTPEYMLAYLLLQLWGPSMLPAAIALILHNGAILGHIIAGRADGIELRIDAPSRISERYLWEVLPRVYPGFLAYLFYRWEVIMRESAILGILGVSTLGFFIDSAMADDKLDKALLLICVSAVLNMLIDATGQKIRNKLRISTNLKEA